MSAIPITEFESKILHKLKKQIMRADLKRIFKKENSEKLSSTISRLICYGLVEQERIQWNYTNRSSTARTYIQTKTGIQTEIKSDDDVKIYRMHHAVKDDPLFTMFGTDLDIETQWKILKLAGKGMQRTLIAKELNVPKKIVIECIIANENEVLKLRKRNGVTVRERED